MTAVDPFHPLLRMVDRYRRDVHQLHPAPAAAALSAALDGLEAPIPASLDAFLRRWDGADLFRGALRVRSVNALAPASTLAPRVIVFADGPRPEQQWAYTEAPDGEALFGLWATAAGQPGRFVPLHRRFDRWLHATARILDEDIRDEAGQLDARLDADPDCAWLLLAKARHALGAGRSEEAARLLVRATAADPALDPAWALLGQAQLAFDEGAARFSLLKAIRGLRLPGSWPGAWVPEPALIHAASRLMPQGDAGWERELVWLLEDRVADTRDSQEAALVEAATVELAQNRLARGERREARVGLQRFLERCPTFSVAPAPAEVLLLLARIESDLGEHDEAERHLRPLRGLGGAAEARCHLALGRIAVQRQEPWAEEMLHEALDGLESSADSAQNRADLCEIHLLLAERHRVGDRADSVEAHLVAARRLVDLGLPAALAAQVALAEGDLLLHRGDLAGAESRFRLAREQAGDDNELLNRILIRRGDLFRLHGDDRAAATDYVRAARALSELGLPLREAWAWLRLGRMGDVQAADQARALFKAADHAAGVASADACAGDPGRSLGWHLERSAEHARERANAWRVRPPLTRADADRPERRLGAHRMAIAACDVAVVANLAAWLEQTAKSLDTATPRLSDPNLSRYVAAADLLAAHRSYEAAEALLKQLLEIRPAGYAGRALVGAMARSPNAALVNGLLEALEGGFDPAGMALAAEVIGWRREPEAVDTLRRLLRDDSPRTVRKAAVTALGRIGDPAAIDDLLGLLDEPNIAEAVSTSLLLLGEWQGVDSQAQALAARGARGAASHGEIVGRYGGPSYLLLLVRVAEQEGPAGIGALQGLGYLGDPRGVPHLLEALGSRDPTRNRVASVSLELITGHHEDPEESLLRGRWMEWWDRHGGDFQPGQRYRHGVQLDPGVLIDRMDHDDPGVRRSTYDELVISTGVRLPFDAEGPWRVQRAHRRAWARWWRDEAAAYPTGRWFFFGDTIG